MILKIKRDKRNDKTTNWFVETHSEYTFRSPLYIVHFNEVPREFWKVLEFKYNAENMVQRLFDHELFEYFMIENISVLDQKSMNHK